MTAGPVVRGLHELEVPIGGGLRELLSQCQLEVLHGLDRDGTRHLGPEYRIDPLGPLDIVRVGAFRGLRRFQKILHKLLYGPGSRDLLQIGTAGRGEVPGLPHLLAHDPGHVAGFLGGVLRLSELPVLMAFGTGPSCPPATSDLERTMTTWHRGYLRERGDWNSVGTGTFKALANFSSVSTVGLTRPCSIR